MEGTGREQWIQARRQKWRLWYEGWILVFMLPAHPLPCKARSPCHEVLLMPRAARQDEVEEEVFHELTLERFKSLVSIYEGRMSTVFMAVDTVAETAVSRLTPRPYLLLHRTLPGCSFWLHLLHTPTCLPRNSPPSGCVLCHGTQLALGSKPEAMHVVKQAKKNPVVLRRYTIAALDKYQSVRLGNEIQ